MSEVSLREYIEAVMEETRRAVETAEGEREKAATVLRESLERSISQGDSALRDHITNQVMQIKSSLSAAERATDKFEKSVTERFATVNEFRGSLDDLGKTMATRRELEALTTAMGNKIDEIAKQVTELRSRLDVGPAGLSMLQSRMDTSGGQQAGRDDQRKGMYAALAATAAVISIVIVLSGVFNKQKAPAPVVVTVPAVTQPTP